MTNRKLIDIIFTNSYIDKHRWLFRADIDWNKTEIEINDNHINWKKGVWYNGIWNFSNWETGTWHDGVWRDGWWRGGTWLDGSWQNGAWLKGTWNGGSWYNGEWRKGTWKGGEIYDPKLNKYRESKVAPNKCKWSFSYEK